MVIDTAKVDILLAERGWSKLKLAEKCGVTGQAVTRVLRRGTCRPETAGNIANALGVHVTEIINEVKL